MKVSVAVLVSEGRHPGSGRARRADLDARALEIGMQIPDADLAVVNAGPVSSPALREYLGMGLKALHVISMPGGADPTEALIRWLMVRKPDIILAGRRAEADEGSGFLPYKIASHLCYPLLSDACRLSVENGKVQILQSLPKGRRRRLQTTLPAFVTIGPSAPTPRQSAFAKSRRGQIVVEHGAEVSLGDPVWTAVPAKRRPKHLKSVDPAANAEERLKAITEMAGGEGEVVAGLSAHEAADRLVQYLARLNFINENKNPGRGNMQ